MRGAVSSTPEQCVRSKMQGVINSTLKFAANMLNHDSYFTLTTNSFRVVYQPCFHHVSKHTQISVSIPISTPDYFLCHPTHRHPASRALFRRRQELLSGLWHRGGARSLPRAVIERRASAGAGHAVCQTCIGYARIRIFVVTFGPHVGDILSYLVRDAVR